MRPSNISLLTAVTPLPRPISSCNRSILLRIPHPDRLHHRWYYGTVQSAKKSRKYLLTQLSIIMTFFVTELVLVVLSQQNPEQTRKVMLHSLQGLSLLQGSISKVRILMWNYMVADNRTGHVCCKVAPGPGFIRLWLFSRGNSPVFVSTVISFGSSALSTVLP
ncbi:hypothetical protein BKA61DRAFT_43650 [Leptodontidium sp. MPI-SDFR-AT-0119]|nr:hypothetical protein BKA61DRAFT_43650 [Leptodontidium sp. MPI-SDFR-AT-0119]